MLILNVSKVNIDAKAFNTRWFVWLRWRNFVPVREISWEVTWFMPEKVEAFSLEPFLLFVAHLWLGCPTTAYRFSHIFRQSSSRARGTSSTHKSRRGRAKSRRTGMGTMVLYGQRFSRLLLQHGRKRWWLWLWFKVHPTCNFCWELLASLLFVSVWQRLWGLHFPRLTGVTRNLDKQGNPHCTCPFEMSDPTKQKLWGGCFTRKTDPLCDSLVCSLWQWRS